jgi:hypothetical protein
MTCVSLTAAAKRAWVPADVRARIRFSMRRWLLSSEIRLSTIERVSRRISAKKTGAVEARGKRRDGARVPRTRIPRLDGIPLAHALWVIDNRDLILWILATREAGRERHLTPRCLSILALLGVVSASVTTSLAQDLEPRRWTHLPVGTNILGIGYEYANGNIRFDPALRIRDAKVELHTAAVAYSRYFRLCGVSLGLPITRNQSVRVAYIRNDTLADTGTDAHRMLLTWNLRF